MIFNDKSYNMSKILYVNVGYLFHLSNILLESILLMSVEYYITSNKIVKSNIKVHQMEIF